MADLFTIDDAKRWLNISATDSTRDDILASLVTAASEVAIKEMGQDPTRRPRTVMADGFGGAALPLNHYPITAVASVTINPAQGGQPLPASAYYFDDNLIYLVNGRFPVGKRNIQVTYTAGLADVPAAIQTAGKYIMKAFWDARLTDMNASGESFSSIGGSGFWPTGPGSVPPQALDLLHRFQNPMKV